MTTTGDCCHTTRQDVVDQRAKELLQWLGKENMDMTKGVTYFKHDVIIAHGGGWGDFQGGSGDNYFHTLQALASVSFLLPRLKADRNTKLLIRICKQPWYVIRSDYYKSAINESSEEETHAWTPQDGVVEGWGGWNSHEGSRGLHANGTKPKAFRCRVDAYVIELFRILDIPLRQVAHYPYDEHDPSFSSLSYRFNRNHYQRNSPLIKAKRALIQPPHVQVRFDSWEVRKMNVIIEPPVRFAVLIFVVLHVHRLPLYAT